MHGRVDSVVHYVFHLTFSQTSVTGVAAVAILQPKNFAIRIQTFEFLR